MRLAYNPKLKARAKELRQKMTLGEVLVWQQLKAGQRGYDFHRQKPIDEFIINFFCSPLRLAIEIDGSTHNFKVSQDETRQKKLKRLGIHFLRFTENDVRSNLAGVVAAIDIWIRDNPSP